jgi:stress response protein YsnF
MARVNRPRPDVTLPVIQERIDVGKTVEETGAVRVRVIADEAVENAELPCAVEQVSVERVSVGRAVRERSAPRVEGDVVIVPVYEEVVFVKRRLMLKEEIHLKTQRTTHVGKATFQVRRERAVVERRNADGEWVPVDTGDPPTGRADLPVDDSSE